MQKKLIALAVAGLVAAPAFAATSNVDVYGVLNMSIGSIDADVTNVDRSTSVTSNSSRFGIKGSEDLGGGLKALWQVESGINLDEQNGTLSNRNSFVGLSGGFGTVLVGNHDTPMKLVHRKVDNFGDTLVDSRNVLGARADTGATMFDLRTRNTIAYVSPNFSGLTVTAAYVTDHESTALSTECVANLDCNVEDAYSLNAIYENGPLMLGGAYEKHNISTGGLTSDDRDMWRLVGGYTFGNFKVGALYENGSGSAASGVNFAVADRSGWGVFANYAMGNITLKANYLSVDDYGNTTNTAANQWTLGADYALSKRTTAYALYGKIKNDAAAAYGIGVGANDSDQNASAGADPSVIAVGVRHSF